MPIVSSSLVSASSELMEPQNCLCPKIEEGTYIPPMNICQCRIHNFCECSKRKMTAKHSVEPLECQKGRIFEPEYLRMETVDHTSPFLAKDVKITRGEYLYGDFLRKLHIEIFSTLHGVKIYIWVSFC
jgi:hypothetical protein